MQDIQIREFIKEDLAGLYRLLQNTVDNSYRGVYPPEAIKLFKDYQSEKQIINDAVSGYTIVAVYKDRIVGTGTIRVDHISRVYIEPEYQRYGIGKSIVTDLENKAIEENVTTLYLNGSLVSKEFWKAMGYNIQKEDYIPVDNNERLYLYRMSKSLR